MCDLPESLSVYSSTFSRLSLSLPSSLKDHLPATGLRPETCCYMSAVALGEGCDLSDGVGLDEPFTAFHRGSETGVSHDEVKFVRLVAFDSKGLRMEEPWVHITLIPTL